MPEKTVAVVGSPSTNADIVIDLLTAATTRPLVGAVLCLEQVMDDGTELALGTVTEVTTTNKWHADPVLRGIIKDKGQVPGMTGDIGDTRQASIRLQAAYRRVGDDYVQSGPSLRMSPGTGTPIAPVTNELVTQLVAHTENLHHMGTLLGTDVVAPFNMRDFSGSRGAYHGAIMGQSGSGKTSMACYALGSQMRHPDLGFVIIDPQGQFSGEKDLPFSLQAWAAELGREVMVHRISEDLRLDKDATLFGALLSKTKFLKELMKMSAETQDLVTDELVKALRATDAWEEHRSEDLLDALLRQLREPHVLRNVYADVTRRERLLMAFSEVLGEAPEVNSEGEPVIPEEYVMPPESVLNARRADVLSQFAPLHNLFSRTNPQGGRRRSLWGAVKSVFDRPEGVPAPVLILDMSTAGGVGWLDEALADEDAARVMEARRILDQESIKAAILSRVCTTLKNASEDAFRGGRNLNTMVVFDEAWRFAPPPSNPVDDEVRELSTLLATFARDTRKFGVGWFYITQTPRSLNPDIWDQLTVRFLGHGLSGAELAKVGEILDGRDHLNLYRSFSPPDSTNPRVYPFMVCGPVSPLSFTAAPMFIAAPTDFDVFRDDNSAWIEPIRLAQGLAVLAGTPASSGTSGANSRKPIRPGGAKVAAQVEKVRAHRESGGVDPSNGRGLSSDPGFSGSLSAIDDETPPF